MHGSADFPRDHRGYTADRIKVSGLFSDETRRKTITEFVSLKAKSYAFKIDEVKQIKTIDIMWSETI